MPSRKPKYKMCKWALIIAVLLVLPLNTVHANADGSVLQAYITEQTLTVFTDTALHADVLTCAVSNQSATITACGSLHDDGTIIKTTVLLDISTSIPSAVRNEVIATLRSLVEKKSANEEFKLVVFGDEMNTLQDFTSDRYDLATAIDKIEFNGTQSKIYDAIFNTIPRTSTFDGKPTFYRTIVITDGVDDTATGITKEELYIRLQNDHYPIDVITVSRSEIAEDKELSAIVRMSRGRYFSLIESTDTTTLASTLGVNGYYFFEATVPAVMLDGTTRQVDVGDGTNSINIDVKFPVFNVPGESTPEPSKMVDEETTTPEPTLTPEATISPLPVETTEVKTMITSFGEYTIVIYIGAGIALVVLIAIIIVLSIVRSKKKNSMSSYAGGFSTGHSSNSGAEKTEFFSDENTENSQYTIKVSHSNNPGKTWTLAIMGDLLIGRAEHCKIRLDDKSVSREQCKIVTQGSGLAIVHMGSTNKTTLNGSNVVGNAPLQSGDTIKIGRETLRIDYIQALGAPLPKQGQPQNASKGNTESIF